MEISDEFKYAVVQFLELPNKNIDDYTCIPHSWIKVRRVTDRKSIVAYPNESPSLIEKRVKKAETASEKWKLYMAIVKHETASYEDANNFIMARRHDSSTKNRCSDTMGTDRNLLQATTSATEMKRSSLKRVKLSEPQSKSHQKKLRVVDKAGFANFGSLNSSKSSESSNNEMASLITSHPVTKVSSEKLMTVGKSTNTQKVSYQNSANNSSFSQPSSFSNKSSENKSRCLPIDFDCKQQDLRTTGLIGKHPTNASVITKSPSLHNDTVQHTLNLSNQPFQLLSHLHQNQLLPSHQDRLVKYPHLQEILEKPKETQVISPGTRSQSIAGNTLHAALNPLILANQISQGFQQPQGNQLSSIYQDHLQQIALNQEIHKRTLSNLQALLPGFSKNQKCPPGFEQNAPFAVQNPTHVASLSSQIPTSSVYQDHANVLLTQESPIRQPSEVNYTNPVPLSTSYGGVVYVPYTSVGTLNSVGQSYFPIQHPRINQQSHLHEDPSTQEIIVNESTEISCTEQNVLSEPSPGNKSSAILNSQNQSIECSIKVMPKVDKVTKNYVSLTQDVDSNEQSTTEKITERRLGDQNSSEQASQEVDSITNIQDLWLDQTADLFDRINSDFSQTCKIAKELHEALVQSAKTFQLIATVSANLRNLRRNKAAVVTPKEVTVEAQKVSEKEKVQVKEKEKSDKEIEENEKEDNNEPERSDDDDKSSNDSENTDEDDDDEDKDKDKGDQRNKDGDKDKDKVAPKKIRGRIGKFVLPPEYDPKDTKWTLKYRKPDPKLGLVELVKKSGVYINAIKLAHCKRVSKDSKTLARMLLVEIFSQNALSVCSLTGARANAFDISGTSVRPGLDEHARMVILSYVEKHARQNSWGAFDMQTVINSIRSKIQEMRAKYGKKL